MIGDPKEVRFDEYCSTCIHRDTPEGDPEGACFDCLENSHNIDSHKPTGYKPDEDELVKKSSSKVVK